MANKVYKRAQDYFAIGSACSRSGKAQEAEKAYRKALKLGPKLKAAMWDLAHMLKTRGANKEAILYYQKYLKASGSKLSEGERKTAQQRIDSLSGG
jgi:tetratricopeptide (TPR) repeat protein